MPFWIILDHDAIMRLVTISSYVFSIGAALFGLWIGVSVAREWAWRASQKFIRPLRWLLMALQAGAVLLLIASLAISGIVLGGIAGRLVGFGLGYAGIPVAYVIMLAFGVCMVIDVCAGTHHSPSGQQD